MATSQRQQSTFLPSSMVEELGPYTGALLTGPSVTAGERQLELHLGWVWCWGHRDSLELMKRAGKNSELCQGAVYFEH